ncbi:Oxysterol-binding protein 3 [Savitreella phatthalungensis]
MDVQLEQVQVLNRDIFVKYVDVPAGGTLHYQIKPQGHSIYYGMWRKHAAAARDFNSHSSSPSSPVLSKETAASTSSSATSTTPSKRPSIGGNPAQGSFYMQAVQRNRSSMSVTSNSSRTNLDERMRHADLDPVLGKVRVAGGKVAKGDLVAHEPAIYALVLDNTFSRDKKKVVTFVLHVSPPATPALASVQPSTVALKDPIPDKQISRAETNLEDDDKTGMAAVKTNPPQRAEEHLSGALLKRRRKKLQGWAKRWFVLDLRQRTLVYYLDSRHSILRGSIRLDLAVVSANRTRFEINIDSGAEVWNLRASNLGAHVMWCDALAEATSKSRSADTSTARTTAVKTFEPHISPAIEDSLWRRVAAVQTKLDRVCQDLDAAVLGLPGASASAVDSDGESQDGSLPDSSTPKSSSRSKLLWRRRGTDASEAVTKSKHHSKPTITSSVAQTTVAALQSHVAELRALCDERRVARGGPSDSGAAPALRNGPLLGVISESAAEGRRSLDSMRSNAEDEVFEDARTDFDFDAFDDAGILVAAHHNADSSEDEDNSDIVSSGDESDLYEDVFNSTAALPNAGVAKSTSALPLSSKQLYPLTEVLGAITRRTNIPPILDAPPSMLSVLRKSVGADSANKAAPVGLNEPLSATQRAAEELEYARLLTEACQVDSTTGKRILLIAAFAISALSGSRDRERCLRKPFNPLLGETFELVREDLGFRFVCEKVEHRPHIVTASYAEGDGWTFAQYGANQQRFYGKSVELVTTGTTTVTLHTGDVYAWEKPIVYLRGVAYGEKYVEPSGTMTIRNLVNGEYAHVEFLAAQGGMWGGGGRSENVTVKAFSRGREPLPLSLQGKWTESLSLTSGTCEVIWEAGKLVDDPGEHCGLTQFAAQLNEITPIEQARLPPTDSRLRPDLRARENADNKLAEQHKAQLEETQRQRRALNDKADAWFTPQWFEKQGQAYVFNQADSSYWNARKRGDWSKSLQLFPSQNIS